MATEIVTLKVNDNFSPELCEKSFDYLRPPPPGLQTFRWGRVVQDSKTVILILNWDSVEAHEAFIEAPIYPTFKGSILAFCSEPIKLYHSYLQPFPPTKVFDGGVVEVAHIKRNPDVSREQFEADVINKLLEHGPKDPGYISHSNGFKHEDNNVFILLVGWKSAEAHAAFGDTDAIRQLRSTLGSLIIPQETSVVDVKLH